MTLAVPVARALAPAKLNLGLEVIGRRSDVFHDISTILQTVSLFDRITMIEPGDGKFTSDIPGLGPEQNLMAVAAKHLSIVLDREVDVDFHLEKRIPMAAGLGGGSSDAATTIRLLCRRWAIAPSDQGVQHAAAATGSDVPFFLTGGRAHTTGRGETVRGFAFSEGFWVIVVVPRVDLPNKSARLYGQLSPTDFTDGSTVERLVAGDPEGTGPYFNAFTRPLYDLFPDLSELNNHLSSLTSLPVSLSGAGPAHFVVPPDLRSAINVLWTLRTDPALRKHDCFLVRSTRNSGPISWHGNQNRV